jgi:hypothetical protein
VPPPEAVSVVLPPEQIDVVPVILAAGSAVTVTVLLAVAVQPAAVVTVTVYVPDVVAVIAADVAPVLHA